MPELPEAEIARRQLARWAEARTIRAVRLPDPKVVRHVLSTRPSDALSDAARWAATLVGRTPRAPLRHGKRIGWPLGDEALLVHLGMTGRFVRRPADHPPPDQARIGFEVDGHVIWFVDGRRFGCVVPVRTVELRDRLREGCGPDALDEALDAHGLRAALASRKPVKVALMEQGRLAGLGNIHAAEACFRAGLSPHRRADALDDGAWSALAAAIPEQLRGAIEAEEGDELVYVNLGGPNPFAVYGRDGEPCRVCGATVRAELTGGRQTYWCPSCQRDDAEASG